MTSWIKFHIRNSSSFCLLGSHMMGHNAAISILQIYLEIYCTQYYLFLKSVFGIAKNGIIFLDFINLIWNL